MIRILTGVLIVLAVLFLLGGGYFLGLQSSSKNASETKTSVTPTATVQPTATVTTTQTPTPTPVKDAITALKEAFDTKNFDSLKPNLAGSVDLLLYATSCCGAKTDQAEIIQFISNSANKGGYPWIFSPTDDKYKSIMNSLKTGEILAVSPSGTAIVFTLDENGKIKKVFSYTDYRLIGS